MTTKFRYLLALAVMLIGFLPMFTTALLTTNYLQLTDYIFAVSGFLFAVHITESRTGYNDNDHIG